MPMPMPARFKWLMATLFFLSLLMVGQSAFANRPVHEGSGADQGVKPLLSAMTIPMFLKGSATKLKAEMTEEFGKEHEESIARGIDQVAAFWRTEDGDAEAFEDFVRTNYISDEAERTATFDRIQVVLEQLFGHMAEIRRILRTPTDLDTGPILPIDLVLATYSPSAHVSDDFFANKVAFRILLNFPLTTLEERTREGASWSRRHWAETRLARMFSHRVPADVIQKVSAAYSGADAYISDYKFWMHHVLDKKGNRLFPAGMKLISHWNLRDELKANYGRKDGLAKQRMLRHVLEEVVAQTVPAVVINNPHVDWNIDTNEVRAAEAAENEKVPASKLPVTNAPEPNTRYQHLLNVFHASRLMDEYSPTAPTMIERRFNEGREIPEARVKQMLEDVVSSPLARKVAKLIKKRLGRRLEAFDIWYSGFKPGDAKPETELDKIVSSRYPTVEAFQKDLPNILRTLGFKPDRAEFVAANVVVDPVRGAGHALGATRRRDKSHLRTNFENGTMMYKGFNVAAHELGHSCEQVFSLHNADYWVLNGVPNAAFTEAMAFVFQNKDLQLLGMAGEDEHVRALRTLDDFWSTFEIAGIGLVDMAVWHWMYDHPEANAEQLKEATIQIAKDIWNEHYAPIFKEKDVTLLAVYSHMINSGLYTPDYPLGHLIAFQIQEHIDKSGDLGGEIERMASIGDIAPDLWMKEATGAPVGPEALLTATEKALKVVKK